MKNHTVVFIAILIFINLALSSRAQLNKTSKLFVAESSDSVIWLKFELGDYAFREMTEGENKPFGSNWKRLEIPGIWTDLNSGEPGMPVLKEYLMIPKEAEVAFDVTYGAGIYIDDIDIGPIAEPMSTDISDTLPVTYLKNADVYSTDALFPLNSVAVSEKFDLRGFDVVMIKIYPFRYNAVRQSLVGFDRINIKVSIKGGYNFFYEDRLRSRWWDPILSDLFINHALLPEKDYHHRPVYSAVRSLSGCDYLIITPDGDIFGQWADTLKKYRTEQGIITEVVSLEEIGGNDETLIKNYLQNAYENWDPVPAAVLFLGDHGNNADSSITTSSGNSDNYYVDFNGDSFPEMVSARITAQNEEELSVVIKKMIDHEMNPPLAQAFYNNITTAAGWDDGYLIGVSAEALYGFWAQKHNRTPTRVYSTWDGNPDQDSWESNSSWESYFGPQGVGYIPAAPNPSHWGSGSGNMINNSINSGSFLVQHNDHGVTDQWASPNHRISHIQQLTNVLHPYVMALSCSSGDFTQTCHAEVFFRHRSEELAYGAIGIMAGSAIGFNPYSSIYSFGFYDYLWPDFLPDQYNILQSLQIVPRDLHPAFANASAKFFLGTGGLSSHTNNINHHLGGAFLKLYDTIPQQAWIYHQTVLLENDTVLSFLAEENLMVTLSIDDKIIETGLMASGELQYITLPDTLAQGNVLVFTAAHKRNVVPYRKTIEIVNNYNAPEIIDFSFSDSGINENGLVDYNERPYVNLKLKNPTNEQISGFELVVVASDTAIILLDSTALLPSMPPQSITWLDSLMRFMVKPWVLDNHQSSIKFLIRRPDATFLDEIEFPVYTAYAKTSKDGLEKGISQDWDNFWESGEEASVRLRLENIATSTIASLKMQIAGGDDMIQPIDSVVFFYHLPNDSIFYTDIRLFAQPYCPVGHQTQLFVRSTDLATNMSWHDTITVRLKDEALVIDLDVANSSATALQQALLNNGINITYTNVLNENIHNYKMAFVCLGTYPDAHALTPYEGILLSEFLLSSNGKLYMEGADTWCYDPQTAVYPLFGIQCIDDGTNNSLGTISAENFVFTMPLSFNYTGDNQYVDQIDTLTASNSEVLLKNTNGSLEFTTAVYRNAGIYQTIGASHEFGGLAEGAFTRTQLMAFYLQLFGIESKVQWRGVTQEWFDAVNWSNGMIPGDNTIITIPTVPPNGQFPELFQQDTIRAMSLILEPGVNLQIPESKLLLLE